jgi:hypothetical protein
MTSECLPPGSSTVSWLLCVVVLNVERGARALKWLIMYSFLLVQPVVKKCGGIVKQYI